MKTKKMLILVSPGNGLPPLVASQNILQQLVKYLPMTHWLLSILVSPITRYKQSNKPRTNEGESAMT